MSIAVECSQCGRQLSVRDELAGKRVKCPCGEVLQAPESAPAGQNRVPAAPLPRGIQPKAVDDSPSLIRAPVPSKPAAVSDTKSTTETPTITITPVEKKQPTKGTPRPSKSKTSAAATKSAEAKSPDTSAAPRRGRNLARRGVPLVMIIGAAAALLLVGGIGFIMLVSSLLMGAQASYDSPEAAYAAFQQSQQSEDWRTCYRTLTPASQQAMVGTTAFIAVMLAAQDGAISQVLVDHGVDHESIPVPRFGSIADLGAQRAQMTSVQQQLLATIANRETFFSDIMPHIKRTQPQVEQIAGQYGVNFAAITLHDSPDLRNVNISGNTGSGTVNVKSLPLQQHFALVEGSWRVDLTRQLHAE
jgi:hypothetical protein